MWVLFFYLNQVITVQVDSQEKCLKIEQIMQKNNPTATTKCIEITK